ncbi:GNAT family N-acetyltransferase [Nocardioides sp.]|uniref:GNAT family N-acetyltransferase n=1 Tax=Nocardioides sp. TaxID=35761 RepID=UPI003D0AEE41
MTTDDSRFATDPADVVPGRATLPEGWSLGTPTEADTPRLAELRRAHEIHGRGWAGTSEADVRIEVSGPGLPTRAHIVIRDAEGGIRAWGSVHDRAEGRMLYADVIDRDLPHDVAGCCSELLLAWGEAQAREVGAARGLAVQQIDTGAFAEDDRQHRWLAAAGFEHVRTWWQMSRPVAASEAELVADPEHWERAGVTFRLVRLTDSDLPEEGDLRAVHDVLEGAFADHFNSREESFDEFLGRLREDPGHRWDHWWLADLDGVGPVGALVGSHVESADGPDGSYVDYLGVLEQARGRGVAKGLLNTIIADAAARGRNRVGLEVDADSPTGAEGLYVAMGWQTAYVTQSWHRDVPVT